MADEIDAGVVGTKRAGSGKGKCRHGGVGFMSDGVGSLGDVGDPGFGAPGHGGDDFAAGHKHPPIFVKVELFGGMKLCIWKTWPTSSPGGRSAGVGERVMPTPCAPNRGLTTTGEARCSKLARAESRFSTVMVAGVGGQRDGIKRGGRFVDTAFDGARIVPDADA